MTIDFSDGYQLLGAVSDRLEQLITIFKILCGQQHKILILIYLVQKRIKFSLTEILNWQNTSKYEKSLRLACCEGNNGNAKVPSDVCWAVMEMIHGTCMSLI